MTETVIYDEAKQEEHTIILPKDVQLPANIREHYKDMFVCPKCESSLIFLPEEYAKNNLVNSLDTSHEIPEKANDNWDRIVVKCDACKYTDLILKFLKERHEPQSLFEPMPYRAPRKPYYTTPKYPYTMGPLRISGANTSSKPRRTYVSNI